MPEGYRLAPVAAATRPRSWVFKGACRGADPELFFPEIEGRIWDNDPRVQKAKAICRRCPVSTQCLFAAIRDREVGIWAGTTPSEREQLRRWEQEVAS